MSSLTDVNMSTKSGSETAPKMELSTVIHETPGAPPRPLNVCMIGYTMYDSDGRVIRYAETLAKRGDRVDFIALKGKGDPDEEVRNGVRLFRIQRRTFKEKSQFSYLFAILAFFFRTMWFFARQDPKVRYDLVHVNSVPDFLVFSAWLPKMRGAKVILDIHDLLPELYISKFESNENTILYRLLRDVERASAAFADYVIAANDIWRDKLVSRARSIHPDRCTSILNFPDRAVFYRRGRTRNDGKFIMVFPGSLNWHQGIDIAIRALGRIKDEAPNAEFHIYGDGPTVPALKALTESLGERRSRRGAQEKRSVWRRGLQHKDPGIHDHGAPGGRFQHQDRPLLFQRLRGEVFPRRRRRGFGGRHAGHDSESGSAKSYGAECHEIRRKV
jgi:glycosyltransferase involved in cell wall biosynthesis